MGMAQRKEAWTEAEAGGCEDFRSNRGRVNIGEERFQHGDQVRALVDRNHPDGPWKHGVIVGENEWWCGYDIVYTVSWESEKEPLDGYPPEVLRRDW